MIAIENKLLTPETLKEMDQEQGKAVKNVSKSKNANPLNEGLEPVNIDFLEKPDEEIKSNELKSFNELINKKTPTWLNVYWYFKGSKNNQKLTFGYKVDEVKLGNAFIKMDNLLSFPKLKSGAVYEPKTGSWRTFKDNEIGRAHV